MAAVAERSKRSKVATFDPDQIEDDQNTASQNLERNNGNRSGVAIQVLATSNGQGCSSAPTSEIGTQQNNSTTTPTLPPPSETILGPSHVSMVAPNGFNLFANGNIILSGFASLSNNPPPRHARTKSRSHFHYNDRAPVSEIVHCFGEEAYEGFKNLATAAEKDPKRYYDSVIKSSSLEKVLLERFPLKKDLSYAQNRQLLGSLVRSTFMIVNPTFDIPLLKEQFRKNRLEGNLYRRGIRGCENVNDLTESAESVHKYLTAGMVIRGRTLIVDAETCCVFPLSILEKNETKTVDFQFAVKDDQKSQVEQVLKLGEGSSLGTSLHAVALSVVLIILHSLTRSFDGREKFEILRMKLETIGITMEEFYNVVKPCAFAHAWALYIRTQSRVDFVDAYTAILEFMVTVHMKRATSWPGYRDPSYLFLCPNIWSRYYVTPEDSFAAFRQPILDDDDILTDTSEIDWADF